MDSLCNSEINWLMELILLKRSIDCLTHWGQVMHICQCNIPTLVQIMACRLFGAKPLSEAMLLYSPLAPKDHYNFSKNLSRTQKFSFKKMHLKTLSAKSWLFCLGLTMLTLQKLISSICWKQNLSSICLKISCIWWHQDINSPNANYNLTVWILAENYIVLHSNGLC